MAAPLVERVARENAGKLIVLKVNSDHAPALSSRYAIQSIPTFLVFREGREAARQVGLPQPAALERWITGAAR
jgi:thioredoxin 2